MARFNTTTKRKLPTSYLPVILLILVLGVFVVFADSFSEANLAHEKEILEIVEIQIKSIQKMLAKNGVTLSVTREALEYLGKEGYDPEFGARPVKRVIQRLVLNQLSKDILAQKVDGSRPIVIDIKDGNLHFNN